jgi:hypothetical protein
VISVGFPTRLDGLPARPCGFLEGLHLILGEQAIGMADPHVLDDGVDLGRTYDRDPVGDVVDQHGFSVPRTRRYSGKATP